MSEMTSTRNCQQLDKTSSASSQRTCGRSWRSWRVRMELGEDVTATRKILPPVGTECLSLASWRMRRSIKVERPMKRAMSVAKWILLFAISTRRNGSASSTSSVAELAEEYSRLTGCITAGTVRRRRRHSAKLREVAAYDRKNMASPGIDDQPFMFQNTGETETKARKPKCDDEFADRH